MKIFTFKLDGLLKLRRFNEQKVKVELSLIVKEVIEVKDEIKKILSEIDDAYNSMEEVTANGINGAMIRFYPYYITGKREHIVAKKEMLEVLDAKFSLKQQELGKARGEVVVIENLREKKLEEYKKEFIKEEDRNNEDISIMRGFREEI